MKIAVHDGPACQPVSPQYAGCGTRLPKNQRKASASNPKRMVTNNAVDHQIMPEATFMILLTREALEDPPAKSSAAKRTRTAVTASHSLRRSNRKPRHKKCMSRAANTKSGSKKLPI